MEQPAIVISGAEPFMKPAILKFTSGLCEITDAEIDLILRPGAELALGKVFKPLPKGDQAVRDMDRVLHDIIRTDVQRALAMRHRACHCVIIGKVGVPKDSDYLDECKQFVMQEREAVAEWGMFKTIDIAILTSDYEFVRE